ncbi:MAG: hypothetical protein ACPMAQ_10190, partial [Phycisphaerae bacterium]
MSRSRLVVFGGLLAGLAMAPARADERLDRGVVALRRANGDVYVGWRLLAADPKNVAFHVYRGASAEGPFTRLTREPIRDSTNFVDDSAAAPAQRGPLYYSVQAVVGGEPETPGATVPLADTPGGASCIRIRLDGRYTFQKAAVADLDGDGRYDYVIKQPNFNVDPYEKPGYWKRSEDTYKLEAYRSDGTLLWRYEMGWSIEEGIWYSPYVVYDL